MITVEFTTSSLNRADRRARDSSSSERPGGGRGWAPWNAVTEEAIGRIADGYNGVPGYLYICDDEIAPSEIFRARITDSGRRRLRELGGPYENDGDPRADVPYLHA
ncbi:hypothetical protein [Nocardia farcinica]|uniref:hypothetical protein n=1 Tax=Nocardia farcinica TaxID=37329 RepID=UPI0011458E35|nr:hypothetical protein [Nocardia farcinica]